MAETPKSQFTELTTTRQFRFTKKEYYVYKNTCLLKSLKVKKNRECKRFFLIINGVKLKPTSEDNNFAVWDFAAMRKNYQTLLGMNQEEHNMLRLEDTFYYNEVFTAAKYYTKIPSDALHSSVMTSELQIALFPIGTTLSTFIEAEEEVYLSDVAMERAKEIETRTQ